MKKSQTLLLKIAAIQTLLMAIYHFFIPFQFQWSNFLTNDAPTINWSLYALNNYFSFNLLIVALFLVYHLLYKKQQLQTIKVLSIIATLFWCFSAVYQIIEPMPLPVSLSWLGYALPGLALINIGIFSVPLKELIKS
ncbi:hypothetical protein A9Q86_16080 [Flavobacteriales bacterium 33_180_T64]|nr:hypothetical protein A9Q86_16080 [Flavobacteriales bacterium 33_180_T64]